MIVWQSVKIVCSPISVIKNTKIYFLTISWKAIRVLIAPAVSNINLLLEYILIVYFDAHTLESKWFVNIVHYLQTINLDLGLSED